MLWQCKDVPKKIHSSKPEKKCNTVPREKCHSVPKSVPIKKCYHVPKQHCEQVPDNKHTPILFIDNLIKGTNQKPCNNSKERMLWCKS